MQTLLFDQDWNNKFPMAVVHKETKNKSFLEFADLLERMGVKNNKFHLTLLQPELAEVDPHDEDNLTEAQMTAIRIECQWNPWYFIREVLRVPPQAGDTPVRLRANRGNISLWWSFLNHLDYFLVQIRQTGKSLNSDGISLWYQVLGGKNSRSNLFTKGDLFKEHIARLKRLRKLLPSYLVRITSKDTDNQKEFTNYAMGNRMVVYIPRPDEDAARNLGRGLSTPYQHTDEVGYLKNVHISLPVMLSGGGAARAEAAANGLPYGNIFTTTAGQLDTDEGAFAHKLMSDGCEWGEHLYDCKDQDDLYATVRKHCRPGTAMLISGTFSHRQLGYTDAWLKQKIAESRQTGDDLRRDFLNEWTSGTASNPLSKNLLRKIFESVTPAVYTKVYPEKYTVKWYISKSEVESGILNRQLVMGVDTSNAVGRDSITGVIVDNSTLEVVGVWGINETNLQMFSSWLTKFIRDFPTMTVIGENKSTWQGIVDYMILNMPSYGVDITRRLFSLIVDRQDDNEMGKARFQKYAQSSRGGLDPFRKFFGFPTDGPLRELIYGTVLQEAAKQSGSLVRDKRLQGELSGLVTKNNRIDHKSGRHDDHVISWLLCHWFLTYARNIDYYGVDKANVKRRVYEAENKLTWSEQREYGKQRAYREEIDHLMDTLKSSRNPIELSQLQHRLEYLMSELENTGHQRVMNIDQLREEMNSTMNMQRVHEGPGRSIDVNVDRVRQQSQNPFYRNRNVVVC